MSQRPDLILRLPNHLGDTLMGLPAIERLVAAGHSPVLIGRPWARSLLAGYPWTVLPVADGLLGAARQLRRLRRDTGPRAQALLLTNSFSTALAFALGRVRAAGYAIDARGWLLAQPVPVPQAWSGGRIHMAEYYDALAAAYLSAAARVTPPVRLRLTEEAAQRAARLLSAAAISGSYVMLCPGARGLHRGRQKAWPGFPRLCERLLRSGHQVVALPGPGERDEFVAALPGARILPEADVLTFAVVLARARLVVANDSGSSHLAAAVGAPLVVVFGVTEPVRTRPWTDAATLVGGSAGWPPFEEVASVVELALR